VGEQVGQINVAIAVDITVFEVGTASDAVVGQQDGQVGEADLAVEVGPAVAGSSPVRSTTRAPKPRRDQRLR
jgi:hypothetical protein